MKINWLLILQAWAMLWVVIGHSRLFEYDMAAFDTGGGNPLWASYLGGFPYAFHMALFIFVSGYLFYKTRIAAERRVWKYADVMKEKLIRLGVPFLAFTIFAIVVKSIFSADMQRPAEISLGYFLYSIVYPYNGAMRELWFVATILWCFALFPIWKWSLGKTKRACLVLVSLLFLNFWDPEIYFLSLGRFCRYVVYFYLGMLSCKLSWCQSLVNYHKVLTLAIGMCLLFSGEYLKSIDFMLSLASLLAAVGGIIASVAIAFILDRYTPKVFYSFRGYTYQIYLMGIFFQIAIKIIYKHIDCPYVLGFIACILVGLYGPVVVSIIFQKINWAPLLRCIGLTKKV